MRRVAVVLAMLGCNASERPLDAEESSTSSGTTTTSSTTSSPWPPPPLTSYDSYSIIDEPDLGGLRCDLWGQDCPPGEKCMAYSNDGDSAWNATRCTPVAPDAKPLGEQCSVVDSVFTGIDDCERGAMCWFVDPGTLVGECIGLCRGSEANPFCEDPCAHCTIAGEGMIIPCLRDCDPLAQSCAEGRACYPIVDAFACAPDVSARKGFAGDTCEFINVCDPGLFCANPELVPGCDGPSCCTPFCNVDEPDECDAQIPGSVCVPWFDPIEYAETCLPTGTIGYCGVPA